ncbi:MAG TPA: hypothetical protein PK402_14585, partial [Tepidisphaeraceae bacterium]|nr:hypothetical protein [Tepidisphaeraceae bacterium]
SALNGMSVKLAWADGSSDETGFEIQRRLFADSNWQTIATIGAGETTYTDSNASINTKYDYRVRAIGAAADSPYSNTSTITTPSITLSATNVGGSSGSTSTVTPNVSYNLTGSGADINNRTDQFRYLRRQLTGDFDVRVKIDSITAATTNAMAGLMIRDTLDANSRNIFAKVKKDGSLSTSYRSSTGGGTSMIANGSSTFPNVYLRVTREGNVFTTYYSVDSFNWTKLARVTMSLPQKLYVGMAVASYSPTGKATAAFRDFVVE